MGRRRSKKNRPQQVSAPVVRASFDLAQTTAENKKHWASADGLSSRAALSPAVRRTVRIRSRYEAENNSWYSGILRTATNHIVGGTGPRLQLLSGNPEADRRIERAWSTWCRAVDFTDTLRMAVEAYWRDGEVFLIKADSVKRYPISLDVRLIEADQVASPWLPSSIGDPFQDDGIRFNRNTDEIEVYVYDHHPGSTSYSLNALSGQWYPARKIVAHLFRAERPGQVRGIPRATPALQTLPIMRRQELATLYSAETAANFAMYLKATGPAVNPSSSPADFAEIELTRNMLTTLPEGWEIGQVEPKQPGPLYEMFQRQALMSFARCTNMPYSLAAGTGKDSNFSSFKGDMKNVWEPEVRVEQNRIENTILSCVLNWFFESAVYSPGLLDGAPPIQFIEQRWHWPPLPELDAVESAKAAMLRMSSGLSGPSEEYARRGADWDTESVRAASDFGVSVEEYKRAAFNSIFKIVAPGGGGAMPVAAQAELPTGEYTELGQRAFNNNMKRIQQTLGNLASGDVSESMARMTLESIGLAPDRIDKLLSEALETT